MSASARVWLLNPAKDIVLFFPAIWGLLAIVIASSFFPTLTFADYPWRLFTFINSIHTGMPIAYSLLLMDYIPVQRRRSYWIGLFCIFVGSFAVVQLAKFHLQAVLVGLPTVFIMVSTYHFYRQDLGVCSMYRGVNADRGKMELYCERFLVVLFALIGPTLYWLGTGTRYFSLIDHLGGPLPLSGVLSVLRMVGFVSFFSYLAYQLCYRRAFSPRFLYLGGLFLSFMTMFQSFLFALPFMLQHLFRIHTHNWIEISFQAKLLREEWATGERKRLLKVIGCLAITALLTYFFTFSKQTYAFMDSAQNDGVIVGEKLQNHLGDIGFELWAVTWIFASMFHYWVGRYVYDFSIPQVRKKLSFGEPQ